ncbi:50S ribosomal protein L24 [Halorubrum gandharaense]
MTKQPRKQRNQSESASLHQRQNQVRATFTEELREEYGQRNVRVNAGDTVEVLRGDHVGTTGEVVAVDLSAERITVEDVTVEKSDGEEVPRPIPASNVRVTELDLEDERREARLQEDNE